MREPERGVGARHGLDLGARAEGWLQQRLVVAHLALRFAPEHAVLVEAEILRGKQAAPRGEAGRHQGSGATLSGGGSCTLPEVPAGMPGAPICNAELRTTADRLESGTGGWTYDTAKRQAARAILSAENPRAS